MKLKEQSNISHEKPINSRMDESGNSISNKDKRVPLNDLSININADISDIVADNPFVPTQNKATPAFKNKEMINFYDGASEDLSMLKDIMSNRSNGEDVNLLNQSKETTRNNRKD